jgi:anti-anti-sigma regulatory factor
MDHDRIVVRPVGHIDAAGLDALRSLLECARATGATAIVDLTEVDADDVAAVDALTAGHAVTS